MQCILVVYDIQRTNDANIILTLYGLATLVGSVHESPNTTVLLLVALIYSAGNSH